MNSDTTHAPTLAAAAAVLRGTRAWQSRHIVPTVVFCPTGRRTARARAHIDGVDIIMSARHVAQADAGDGEEHTAAPASSNDIRRFLLVCPQTLDEFRYATATRCNT